MGAVATAPRPACRTSSPAASRSRRVAARSARADRRRQGEEPRGHGRQAGRAVSQRADAEGGDGQQLDDGGVARHRGAEEPAARSARQARRGASRRSSHSKDYKDFMAQRASASIYAPPDEFAKFMAKSRRRPGRDDEGGRHRQVTRVAAAVRGAVAARRTRSPPGARAPRMKLNDAVWGALLLLLAAAVLVHVQAFRHDSRASKYGPAIFPGPRRRAASRSAPCC